MGASAPLAAQHPALRINGTLYLYNQSEIVFNPLDKACYPCLHRWALPVAGGAIRRQVAPTANL